MTYINISLASDAAPSNLALTVVRVDPVRAAGMKKALVNALRHHQTPFLCGMIY